VIRAFSPAAAWLSLVLICWLAAACTPVQPWQRGHLAKPQMALEPYPAQRTLREHVYGSREAVVGTGSASGGGCGCY